MRLAATCLLLVSCASVQTEPDALALLKRDLGTSIQVSPAEVRFCPDNTCDIYSAAAPSSGLATFVYLHLFHESDYSSLEHAVGGEAAFRDLAVEEPIVRASAASFCPKPNSSPRCILDGMRSQLGIKVCSGRYDEGSFCDDCSGQNRCRKL